MVGGVPAAVLLSAFTNAPTGIAVLAAGGVVSGGNPALGQILGRELAEVLGGDLFRFVHPEDLALALDSGRELISRGAPVRVECRFLRPDATPVWVRVSTSRVPGTADQPLHAVMHVEDISDQKALEARLQHQATRDPLTGLGNRALLEQQVQADLAACSAHEAGRDGPRWRYGLVLLDLDGFKALNDSHGHLAGDEVLIEVGARVQGLLGPGEVAVRLGGDEFAVWCPVTTDTAVVRLVDALRVAVAEPLRIGTTTARLSASLGSTTHGGTAHRPDAAPDGDLVLELLRAADIAMYRDKRQRG